MVRYHLVIHGKVQGVGYRFFAQQQASYHRIKGWVKNNDDGTVEVDAEGTNGDINAFLNALKKGSGFSRVTTIDIHEIQEPSPYKSFKINH